LCTAIVSWAQATETFDIATFQPPKGWTRQTGQNTIQFSAANETDYCLITLYRSIPGIGNAKENSDAAWKTLVKEAVNISTAPKFVSLTGFRGWEIYTTHAPFEKSGSNGVAMLVTASGFGKMMNALILTDTQAYESEIAAFLGSIDLKAQQSKPAGETNSAIVGQWGVAHSDQSSFAVSNGISGYIKKQYTFNPDGTYEFLIKTFAYTSTNLLFTKETGTYQLSGNTLTVTPQKSYIQAWTKARVIGGDGRSSETDEWGKLVSTQSRTLEKTIYEVSKNYLSGIDKWQLLMKSAKPTERDGPFSGGAAFPNTWFYETTSFPIKGPKYQDLAITNPQLLSLKVE
jgi:hypothetical protein